MNNYIGPNDTDPPDPDPPIPPETDNYDWVDDPSSLEEEMEARLLYDEEDYYDDADEW